MITQEALSEMAAISATEGAKADLQQRFFRTQAHEDFRKRIFHVLEAREKLMEIGVFEQKGAALIGPSGCGKSTMTAEIIREYEALAVATGGRKYGHKIISVIVPGKASVKDTCQAILQELGYPSNPNRTEDYLIGSVRDQLEHRRIAAIHLDEVQDAGRHSNTETKDAFVKRFRNLSQKGPWPICLILTATPEGRDLINHDFTLTRRLRPIEILPMDPQAEAPAVCRVAKDLIARAGLTDDGLVDVPEFTEILIHAAAYRFGLVVEMMVEAIGEALSDADTVINLDHFAAAYHVRMACDDQLNPFISEHWRGIDTTRAMERSIEDRKAAPRRSKTK